MSIMVAGIIHTIITTTDAIIAITMTTGISHTRTLLITHCTAHRRKHRLMLPSPRNSCCSSETFCRLNNDDE
jgi:hypothetical protein